MMLFADTETTGLRPSEGARLVEVAAVDEGGASRVDTLVDPGVPIPAKATEIHGIGDADVAGKAKLTDMPWIGELFGIAERVVFYNAEFDVQFFPAGWLVPSRTHCAMLRFSAWRQTNGQGSRWVRLADAAQIAGHVWTGAAHRAMADALAARSVWTFLSREFPCWPGFPATIEGYRAAHAEWKARQA